jgi:hypothetical protein
MYLPERVMRQFGLRQSIPPPFRPTLQALHRISRRGRERENWEETHHEYIQEWEARRQRIFPESEQYDPSSYEEYLHWYTGATRRYLVPSISDDVEAGPSLQPDDSIDLQYQAKAPMIRKAVSLYYLFSSYDQFLKLIGPKFVSDTRAVFCKTSNSFYKQSMHNLTNIFNLKAADCCRLINCMVW